MKLEDHFIKTYMIVLTFKNDIIMIKVLKITGWAVASIAIALIGTKVQSKLIDEMAKALRVENGQ